MRKMKFLLVLCLFVFFGLTANASATSFSGSLTGNGGGIFGTQEWNSSSTSLSWIVDNSTNPGFWTYNYTFTVPAKNISHVIIEVSPDASQGDFTAGLFDLYGTQGNSNPGLPENFYGLKFGPGELSLSFSFKTTRVPVWGDFYAKDGTNSTTHLDVYAYNTGFLASDPTNPASDGSINFHILRPDTETTPGPVPEPATMLLLGSGLIGLAGFGRRKFFKK